MIARLAAILLAAALGAEGDPSARRRGEESVLSALASQFPAAGRDLKERDQAYDKRLEAWAGRLSPEQKSAALARLGTLKRGLKTPEERLALAQAYYHLGDRAAARREAGQYIKERPADPVAIALYKLAREPASGGSRGPVGMALIPTAGKRTVPARGSFLAPDSEQRLNRVMAVMMISKTGRKTLAAVVGEPPTRPDVGILRKAGVDLREDRLRMLKAGQAGEVRAARGSRYTHVVLLSDQAIGAPAPELAPFLAGRMDQVAFWRAHGERFSRVLGELKATMTEVYTALELRTKGVWRAPRTQVGRDTAFRVRIWEDDLRNRPLREGESYGDSNNRDFPQMEWMEGLPAGPGIGVFYQVFRSQFWKSDEQVRQQAWYENLTKRTVAKLRQQDLVYRNQNGYPALPPARTK